MRRIHVLALVALLLSVSVAFSRDRDYWWLELPEYSAPLPPEIVAACEAGDLETIKRILAEDCNLFYRISEDGRFLIEIAAATANAELLVYVIGESDRAWQDDPGTDAERRRLLAESALDEPSESAATVMAICAENNDLHIVSLLAELGFSMADGLDEAASCCGPLAVKRLLELGAARDDPEALDDALWSATSTGSLTTVKLLIRHGADPTRTGLAGATLLAQAAASGRPELVDYLLGLGVRLEETVSTWRSPLLRAVTGNDAQAARALIRAGARVDGVTDSGGTALHVAASSGAGPAVLAALLEAGAGVDVVDDSGFTPIELAASRGDVVATRTLTAAMPPSPDTERLVAGAALFAACRTDDADAAEAIVKQTPSALQHRADDGRRPLHMAAEHAAAGVVERLLAMGADPNGITYGRDTPLASALGLLERAQRGWLSPEDAEPLAVNLHIPDDETLPGEIAERCRRCIRLLVEAGADVNAISMTSFGALHKAATAGDAEMVALMLAHGASLDGWDGSMAMTQAFMQGRPDIGRLLVEAGISLADPELVSSMVGTSPCKSLTPQIWQQWVDLGMDIDATDSSGQTVLHRSIGYGDLEFMRYLLAGGAAVNVVDDLGSTPLSGAIRVGNVDVIRLPLEHGADPLHREKESLSPAYCAVAYASPEIADIVLDAAGLQEDEQLTMVRRAKELGQAIGECDVARMTELLNAYPALLGMPIPAPDSSWTDRPAVWAALYAGLERDATPALKLVLERGADMESAGSEGTKPLLWTARSGRPSALQALIGAGANVADELPRGATALHRAFTAANIGALLAAGAEIHATDDNGSTPLHEAAKRGRGDACMVLLAAGADIEARNNLAQTPLHRAVAPSGVDSGHPDMVRMLLRCGADAEARDAEGNTPLGRAVSGLDLNVTRVLLAAGATLPFSGPTGGTPIHFIGSSRLWQLSDDDFALLALLTARGIDINAPDAAGVTALHLAADEGRLVTVQGLLDLGADPNAVNQAGETPLLWAAEGGSPEIVRLLLEAGARCEPQIAEQMLRVARFVGAFRHDGGGEPDARNKTRGTLPRLLEKHPEFALWANRTGETLLHRAVAAEHPEAVWRLLELGADPNARDAVGRTPLFRSLGSPYWGPGASPERSCAQLLLDAGADIHAVDNEGNTLLHAAATMSAAGKAETLVAMGLDPTAGNAAGQTPLHLVYELEPPSVTEALARAGAPLDARDNQGRTPLHAAVTAGYNWGGWSLLALEPPVDAADNDGLQPLHLAVAQWTRPEWWRDVSACYSADMVRTLVSRGADISATDNAGNTPLHHAAMANAVPAARYLIEQGVRLDPRNDARQTPLHFASERGCAAMVRRLIDAGASLHTRDAEGRTPLHCAATADYPDAVKVILRKARSSDLPRLRRARDKAGRTPLDCARQAGHAPATRALEAAGRLQAAR